MPTKNTFLTFQEKWGYMIATIIEELKNGNHKVVDMFVELDKKWGEILDDIEILSVEDIAERLNISQHEIEGICDSRDLGKAIMPWSAFAHFFSCKVDYEDNAESAYKLKEAFAISQCSIEVKVGAEAAAKAYHVGD